MRKRFWIVFLIAGAWILLRAQFGNVPLAQEETYELAHEEVFGKLQRPPVTFPHELHMDALEEEGCGACHHEYDEEADTLVPVEDPDAGCTECHGAKKQDHTPSLRKAYHGRCTGCHRRMARQGEEKPPTTCGGCHERK